MFSIAQKRRRSDKLTTDSQFEPLRKSAIRHLDFSLHRKISFLSTPNNLLSSDIFHLNETPAGVKYTAYKEQVFNEQLSVSQSDCKRSFGQLMERIGKHFIILLLD